jgi:hypothetical protein
VLFHARQERNDTAMERNLKPPPNKKPAKTGCSGSAFAARFASHGSDRSQGIRGATVPGSGATCRHQQRHAFYHFSSKEELIMGVVKLLGEQVQRTPRRPKNRPATALEELRLEFESMGTLLQKRPEISVVLDRALAAGHARPGHGKSGEDL